MKDIILDELLKTKSVSFYNEEDIEIDKSDLGEYNNFIIREKNFKNNNSEVLFIFEDYLIKPFSDFDFHKNFNKGINIPLKIMQGKIIKRTGNIIYIKAKGYYLKSDNCLHCLKEVESYPICKECFTYFNKNDIEDVAWEGFVPLSSVEIKNIGEL